VTRARLVARTVRGIESIVAAEIRARSLGEVEHIGHREVVFLASAGSPVLDLRCADDVFLVAATVDGVGRGRSGLRLLTDAAGSVAVRPLLAVRRQLTGSSQQSTVDVSASFLGRRHYNRYDLEDAVGEPLARAAGLRYVSRRDGTAPPPGLSWRLTVTGDRALLALRLATRPLHRRPYRRRTRPGSLHPPLAAAMLRLTGPLDGRRLLDPCCGAGTIVLGAGGALSAVATDYDRTAVEAAWANGVRAIAMADAGRLPVGRGAVDLVVSNPPWGRQVPASGLLGHDPRRFWSELRRVLAPGGRAVLLLPAGTAAGLPVLARHPVSLFGAHPEVLVMAR
jgi:tRNA (guanine6-N2)-methyltransferase